MSITQLTKVGSTGGGRQPLPEKEYDAVVHSIIDLGDQVKYYMGEAKPAAPAVKFQFEIPGVEEDGGSRIVGYKELKVSVHENSTLMKLLRTLFKASTVDEVVHRLSKSSSENAQVLQQLLGVGVRLTFSSFTNKEGQEMQYVSDIHLLDPRIPAPVPQEEPFIFALTASNASEVYKNRLSPFLQDRIAGAANAHTFSPGLQQAIAEVKEERENSVENKILG